MTDVQDRSFTDLPLPSLAEIERGVRTGRRLRAEFIAVSFRGLLAQLRSAVLGLNQRRAVAQSSEPLSPPAAS